MNLDFKAELPADRNLACSACHSSRIPSCVCGPNLPMALQRSQILDNKETVRAALLLPPPRHSAQLFQLGCTRESGTHCQKHALGRPRMRGAHPLIHVHLPPPLTQLPSHPTTSAPWQCASLWLPRRALLPSAPLECLDGRKPHEQREQHPAAA